MGTVRRRNPRVKMSLACALRRPHGAAIRADTIDLGPGGMCVSTSRPLASDELLSFDLSLDAEHRLGGHARVLREERYRVYALRFEGLPASALEDLQHLTAPSPTAPV
jgi:hypothetical protein